MNCYKKGGKLKCEHTRNVYWSPESHCCYMDFVHW